jgi:hypothetical protein
MICLWYNAKNIPRIVIGPDWHFALIKVVLNQAASLGLMITCFMRKDNIYGLVLLILYFIENISFGFTIFMNPGIAQIDPSIHSKLYLNKVKT